MNRYGWITTVMLGLILVAPTVGVSLAGDVHMTHFQGKSALVYQKFCIDGIFDGYVYVYFVQEDADAKGKPGPNRDAYVCVDVVELSTNFSCNECVDLEKGDFSWSFGNAELNEVDTACGVVNIHWDGNPPTETEQFRYQEGPKNCSGSEPSFSHLINGQHRSATATGSVGDWAIDVNDDTDCSSMAEIGHGTAMDKICSPDN